MNVDEEKRKKGLFVSMIMLHKNASSCAKYYKETKIMYKHVNKGKALPKFQFFIAQSIGMS